MQPRDITFQDYVSEMQIGAQKAGLTDERVKPGNISKVVADS